MNRLFLVGHFCIYCLLVQGQETGKTRFSDTERISDHIAVSSRLPPREVLKSGWSFSPAMPPATRHSSKYFSAVW